jgi:ATP-dependent protease ClpP protease subunit
MALENAAIMVHGISYGTGTSPQKLPFHESYLQMVKAKEEKVCRILAKKTNKPYSYWDKIFKTNEDKWFDAEEALEVGLIDEIIK